MQPGVAPQSIPDFHLMVAASHANYPQLATLELAKGDGHGRTVVVAGLGAAKEEARRLIAKASKL